MPEDEILAANGLEGMLRPLAQQAAGPVLGGFVVALFEPGLAILAASATYVVSAGCLAAMRVASAPDTGRRVRRRAAMADLREAASYVKRTPWLWATLAFAFVAVFFFIGPLEVLAPFAIRDRTGGGSAEYGVLLACFGIGAALGALAISSRPMPRRYLTVMLALWGAGAIPLIALGIANELWIMCAAVAIVGASESAATVIWGTLLQRRVPDGLRGRRLEPRLLRLTGADARIDGARGAGRRGLRAHGRVRRRRSRRRWRRRSPSGPGACGRTSSPIR